jgi:microcystin-dependent protein
VEDTASCQKTISQSSNPSILHQNSNGNLVMSDASSALPIRLPSMQENNTDSSPKIVVLMADGTMKAWEPSNTSDNFIAYWDGSSWKIGPLATLFPSGDGVLIKNTLGQLSFVSGVAGESLQYVGTNIEFATQSFSPVPTGLILPYAAPVSVALPSGYLLCDGAEVAQASYINLFNIIGSTYNTGGESPANFRLPNLQGIFLRGAGSQTLGGVTYNATIGSYQNDAFQGHHHRLQGSNNAVGSPGAGPGVNGTTVNFDNRVTFALTDGTNGTPRTADETRPANLAMRYLIKT